MVGGGGQVGRRGALLRAALSLGQLFLGPDLCLGWHWGWTKKFLLVESWVTPQGGPSAQEGGLMVRGHLCRTPHPIRPQRRGCQAPGGSWKLPLSLKLKW